MAEIAGTNNGTKMQDLEDAVSYDHIDDMQRRYQEELMKMQYELQRLKREKK